MSGRYNAACRNLALLQDLVKKDPESYLEEFLSQYEHYKQILTLLSLDPHRNQSQIEPLLSVVTFISQVAHKYPEQGKEFGKNLIEILKNQGISLDPEIRMSFCKALVLLRNKSIIGGTEIMSLFFELVKCPDKNLRKFLFGSIVAHIKRQHSGKKDPKMNTMMQNYVFAKLKDSRAIVARTALLILIDSFRKGYWRDRKSANAIAECCFHKVNRIQVGSLKFFLGKEDAEEDESEEESENEKEESNKTMKEVLFSYRVGKKTKKRKKTMERAKKTIIKEKKSKKGKRKDCNMMAIQYLFDAQDFVERLFRRLESKSAERFEVRLLQMSLIARIVGIHKLQLLGFYPFLQRYCQPHQREVTRILLFAAQASHDLVPPDVIETLIRAVSQQFITDRNSSEAIAVGLNAVREILSNCPYAANDDLMRDLTEYKKYKNKNVTMAARSLIQLFRKLNPKLLHRKDRGKPTEATKELEPLEFGRKLPKSFVAGAECLPEESEEHNDSNEDENESDSDESGSWVDMSDDEEEDGDEDEDGDEEETDEHTQETDDQETPEAKSERAEIVSSGRILTQEEHKTIKIHQLKKQIEPHSKKNQKKSNDDIRIDDMEEDRRKRKDDGLTRLTDIEHLHKKRRRETKEERKEKATEGREDREKFGRKKKKHAMAGITNKSLAKKKNFSMIKQKRKGQNRQRTFRDRQYALKNYLMKQKGAK